MSGGGRVLRAELELVPVVKERTLVVLGFGDIALAADAVPAILPYEPIALEGVDRHLIYDERLKHLNQQAIDQLPEGNAFLMVQFGAETVEEADEHAHQMLDAPGRGRRGATGFRLLRPRRQLRLRARPPGGQPGLRGTRPAAAAAGGGRRHRGPRGTAGIGAARVRGCPGRPADA
ncbi:hypothetical protein PBV88_52430, partial [Streptomyces sp. T21Q-yed]|nr:hypothetical protein [Streptomyces sp. T21Q-yed]